MKNLIVIFLLFALAACTKSSDTNKANASLIGKWKQTETLNDPGDGSGKWMPVETDDYIEFTKDSTITTNSITTGDIVKFSLPNDSTIIFIHPNYTLSNWYKIQGNQLTLMGGCIEPCGSKYTKQ